MHKINYVLNYIVYIVICGAFFWIFTWVFGPIHLFSLLSDRKGAKTKKKWSDGMRARSLLYYYMLLAIAR